MPILDIMVFIAPNEGLFAKFQLEELREPLPVQLKNHNLFEL